MKRGNLCLNQSNAVENNQETYVEIAMERNCEVVTLAESNKMKKSYASTG